MNAPGAADLARLSLNASRRGDDPKAAIGRAKQPGITLAEIWQAYCDAGYPLLQGIGFLRPSSIKTADYLWKHVSRLGHRPVAKIDTPEVAKWLDTIQGVGARSMALVQLKGLLRFAEQRNLAQVHKIGIKPRASRKIENYLRPTELKKLDAALVRLGRQQPERVLGFAALRLLLHSGLRRGEVLTLDWSWIDLDQRTIRLPRDKASDVGRTVLLSDTACEILRGLPRLAHGGYVFFGKRSQKPLADLRDFWTLALERAKLRHIRVHDLRHSFASAAIGSGVSLHVVGKLLGHRDGKATARYAHISRSTEQEAVARVAGVLS